MTEPKHGTVTIEVEQSTDLQPLPGEDSGGHGRIPPTDVGYSGQSQDEGSLPAEQKVAAQKAQRFMDIWQATPPSEDIETINSKWRSKQEVVVILRDIDSGRVPYWYNRHEIALSESIAEMNFTPTGGEFLRRIDHLALARSTVSENPVTSEELLPSSLLGINVGERKWGPYSPDANRAEIEGRLLNHLGESITYGTLPEGLDKAYAEDLYNRWFSAIHAYSGK